jgi:orotidine-5'-phosphate decarboxylase
VAELVVALDVPDLDAGLALATPLAGIAPWLKVGLELFAAEGPAAVKALSDLGFKVFLDLKLHDIPATVARSTKAALASGADMLTIHALGGPAMLAAAAQARDESAETTGRPVRIMAVTVLTSHTPEDLSALRLPPAKNLALRLAGLAHAAGLNGIVCSPLEAAAIKTRFGTGNGGLECLCQGIRLDTVSGDDQARVAGPAQAVANGADFLVVGRPITRAQDPAQAARRFLEAMAQAH